MVEILASVSPATGGMVLKVPGKLKLSCEDWVNFTNRDEKIESMGCHLVAMPQDMWPRENRPQAVLHLPPKWRIDPRRDDYILDDHDNRRIAVVADMWVAGETIFESRFNVGLWFDVSSVNGANIIGRAVQVKDNQSEHTECRADKTLFIMLDSGHKNKREAFHRFAFRTYAELRDELALDNPVRLWNEDVSGIMARAEKKVCAILDEELPELPYRVVARKDHARNNHG